MLLNAPSTINGCYTALVVHDIANGKQRVAQQRANYLKSLLALGFKAFLIMVCIGILQTITITIDISGAIWACMGYTVLLRRGLFKTGSISKAVFNMH